MEGIRVELNYKPILFNNKDILHVSKDLSVGGQDTDSVWCAEGRETTLLFELLFEREVTACGRGDRTIGSEGRPRDLVSEVLYERCCALNSE